MAVVAGTVVWQYGRIHGGRAINSPDVSGGNASDSAGNSNTVKKISDSRRSGQPKVMTKSINISNVHKITPALQCMQEM